MPHSTRAAFAIGVASCFWAGRAMADPGTHDGFQFRGTVGGGYLADWTSGSGAGATSLTSHGVAGSLELYFGGTPLPGLAVGVVSTLVLPGSNATLFSTNGIYVDYYLDPQGGFHLIGVLGIAQIALDDKDSRISSEGMGTAGLGVGYDWWIGDEWSIGFLGRLTYAMASFESNGLFERQDVLTPTLSLTFTYQ
jgi:hypothetical protein